MKSRNYEIQYLPSRLKQKEEKEDRYVAKLDKHIDDAKEAVKYSSDRFDVLIISLSTSALILSIGFAKNVIPDLKNINTSLLKTALIILVSSLIANLVSQVTGYFSNKLDIKVTRNLIRKRRGLTPKGKQKKLHFWCSFLDYLTLTLNGSSLFLLIIGIVTLVIFFSNNI